MSKRTRQRELARLRARREAERQRARRRRALLTYGALTVGLVAVVVAGVMVLGGGDEAPAASGTTSTASTVDPNAPDNARADAPSAPEEVACGGKVPANVDHPAPDKAPDRDAIDASKTYVATLRTSCGEIVIELDDEQAPLTVANFVTLAREGYYDSTWFHRIVPGGDAGLGVIQGGDPEGTGMGGPGYTILDEPPKAEKPYEKYTVAMAKARQPNSGGSQFFINTKDNPDLPPDYTLFGKVVEGKDVVDRIAGVPVGGDSGQTPQQAVWIEKATIEER